MVDRCVAEFGSDAFSTYAPPVSPRGLPAAISAAAMASAWPDAHVDRAGIGGWRKLRAHSAGVLAFADARRDAATLRTDAALRQRTSRSRARGRERRRDARHHLVARRRRPPSAAISSCARPKSIGSPPFEPHDDRDATVAASTSRLLMKLLRRRVLAATFADCDLPARVGQARSCRDAPARRGTRCRRPRAAARRAASAGPARPGRRRRDRQPPPVIGSSRGDACRSSLRRSG